MKRVFLLLALSTLTQAKIFKDHHLGTPENDHEFFLRPMAYLHHDVLPHEVREKVQELERHPKVMGGDCELSLTVIDYQDYYDLLNGLMYGLVAKPTTSSNNCGSCNYMGSSVGNIQEGVVGLEASRLMWNNKSEIMDLDMWD